MAQGHMPGGLGWGGGTRPGAVWQRGPGCEGLCPCPGSGGQEKVLVIHDHHNPFTELVL